MKKIFLILLFAAAQGMLKADNYFWVGGTGSWSDYAHHWAVSSGAQLYHNHVPTPNDTVIFDSLSFIAQNDSVIGDSAILYCHTMRWTNVQFHPVFMNGITLGNEILRIYGSLEIDTGMTWAFYGKIRFTGLSGGNHIRSSGQYFSLLEFTGDSASSWYLDDSLHAATLYFLDGTFISNGNLMRIATIYFPQGNHAGVQLDTSYVEMSSFYFGSLPVLFDADSTFILFHGNFFDGGGENYGVVHFTQNVSISGGNYFEEILSSHSCAINGNCGADRFFMIGSGLVLSLNGATQLLISDTIFISGSCYSVNAIYGGMGSALIKSSGTVHIDAIVLDNVSATGGASFDVTDAFLNGNSSGWNVISPAPSRNLFWVNGTGEWNDTAHWSLTSGGPSGECAPTPADNIHIDNLSFPNGNDTITCMVNNSFAGNILWTASSGMFAHTGTLLHDYGDFLLSPGMIEEPGVIDLRSDLNSLLDAAGQSLGTIYFLGDGTYNVMNDLNCGDLYINNGSVDFNGYNVNASDFNGGGTSIDFQGGTLSTNSCIFTTAQFISTPSIINTNHFYDWTGSHFPRVIFQGNADINAGSTFGFVSINGSSFITGSNTFDTLRFLSQGQMLYFHEGNTQTILSELSVNSSCTAPVVMLSGTEGSTSYFYSTNATINVNDVIMEDLSASGGANFSALNTVAIANVNGWNITPPPSGPMYWIGGTGDWNDPAHWSPTSGGAPGSCIPNPLTDVFFDANSFTTTSDSVRINIPYAFCNSMEWNGTIGNPYMYDSGGGNVLWCFGSFVIDTNVTATHCAIIFRSVNPGNSVNTNNQMVGYATFSGLGGSWLLTGDLQVSALRLIKGTLKTQGHTIQASSIYANGVNSSLLLDSSLVMTSLFNVENSIPGCVDADSSFIEVTGAQFNGGFSNNYNVVTFTGNVQIDGSDSIRFARFMQSAYITDNNVFDTLFLDNPGYQLTLHNGVTQTLRGNMLSSGTSSAMIGIEAESGNATMLKTTDTLCSEFLVLRGIEATGGATFYAGYYSSNAGNNNGWTFQGCTPAMIDVWPGDANRDLTDDNLDLLAVGLAFGYTVNPRANATNNWTAQPNWVREIIFANGSDIVNADCDGDGVIGFSDTTAILLNYGMTHPPRLAYDSTLTTGWPLYFMTPTVPQIPGDTTSIGFMLGDQNHVINNVYGIAFTLHFEAGYIDPGTSWIETTNAWLAPSGYEIHILHEYAPNDRMDVAISRIDHQNISGQGYFGRLHFRLSTTASGVFKCWYSDVTLIDFDEVQYPVIATLGTFPIALGIGMEAMSEFSLYPNPATTSVTMVSSSMSGIASEISIMDLQGRLIRSTRNEGAIQMNLDLSSLPQGTYIIMLRNERGTSAQRIVKK